MTALHRMWFGVPVAQHVTLLPGFAPTGSLVASATDARWHLGNLASFAAWMVLLPDTRQAVVVPINANTELPFNEVNAVTSRLPIGVVNLLRGQPVPLGPLGPRLRQAYVPFNAAAALVVIGLLVLAAALALLCMPSALRVWARARAGGLSTGTRHRPP